MRLGLVSPYSWTYPGGVNRHIEGLTTEYLAAGHDVRVLAPFDGDPATAPEWLISLGRTRTFRFNGAVTRAALTPQAVQVVRKYVRSGKFDVLHVHEPVAPVASRLALALAEVPVVATFHAHSDRVLPHAAAAMAGTRRLFGRISVRIAVSEAAAWTGRRFYGGEYQIIPNGVGLPDGGVPAPRPLRPGEPLEIAFVGQAVERKGLPVLLRAFEALSGQAPARLTLIGVSPDDVDPLLADISGVVALGGVDDAEKRSAIEHAHVLCAPSLGGESFGMVLTEAFAAGTPVVASDIAGYREVVGKGEGGVLVTPGDALALAEALRDLVLAPARLDQLAGSAARAAARYAWPRVADEVMQVYEHALELPSPAASRSAPTSRPERRLAPLDRPPERPSRAPKIARRAATGAISAAVAAASVVAIKHIGANAIVGSVLQSSPVWVLLAVGLMCASMVLRAVSWLAILRAPSPTRGTRLRDVVQGTSIGVLMSATLPARLGEVSRALVVARRLGRTRETLPVVLGTLASQTLLNVVALGILAVVVLKSGTLNMHEHLGLALYALAPVGVVVLIVAAPAFFRSGLTSRSQRIHRWAEAARGALGRVRSGLSVFRRPALGSIAAASQFGAWALQLLACVVLLEAVGLDDQGVGLAAAAAILFAVNVTAVLPLTPSNVGVFQAACVAVLSGGYGIAAADALGYGIVLQAVEIATAVVMGAPALIREGVTWREVRMRALNTAPISLSRKRPPAQRVDA
jgi:phosphatidylinositol alpha-mannosyltransferase